jgi:hypothetical protein
MSSWYQMNNQMGLKLSDGVGNELEALDVNSSG